MFKFALLIGALVLAWYGYDWLHVRASAAAGRYAFEVLTGAILLVSANAYFLLRE
jgi:hypothetical protein